MRINKIFKLIIGLFFSSLLIVQPALAKGKGKSSSTGKSSISKAIKSYSKRSSTKKSKVYLRSLPKHIRNKLNQFPKKHGIYRFMINESGQQYIGKSNNIQRRIKEHVRSGKLPVKMLKSVCSGTITPNNK